MGEIAHLALLKEYAMPSFEHGDLVYFNGKIFFYEAIHDKFHELREFSRILPRSALRSHRRMGTLNGGMVHHDIFDKNFHQGAYWGGHELLRHLDLIAHIFCIQISKWRLYAAWMTHWSRMIWSMVLNWKQQSKR